MRCRWSWNKVNATLLIQKEAALKLDLILVLLENAMMDVGFSEKKKLVFEEVCW